MAPWEGPPRSLSEQPRRGLAAVLQGGGCKKGHGVGKLNRTASAVLPWSVSVEDQLSTRTSSSYPQDTHRSGTLHSARTAGTLHSARTTGSLHSARESEEVKNPFLEELRRRLLPCELDERNGSSTLSSARRDSRDDDARRRTFGDAAESMALGRCFGGASASKPRRIRSADSFVRACRPVLAPLALRRLPHLELDDTEDDEELEGDEEQEEDEAQEHKDIGTREVAKSTTSQNSQEMELCRLRAAADDILARTARARAEAHEAACEGQWLQACLHDVAASRASCETELLELRRVKAEVLHVAEESRRATSGSWCEAVGNVTSCGAAVSAARRRQSRRGIRHVGLRGGDSASVDAVLDAMWREAHTKASTIAVLARRCCTAEAELASVILE